MLIFGCLILSSFNITRGVLRVVSHIAFDFHINKTGGRNAEILSSEQRGHLCFSVSYSHVCESSQIYPRANLELCFLQEQGAVLFLLADGNIDDFFAKREKRYSKDRQRYSFYFDKNQIKALYPRAQCIQRVSSSTEYIRQGLHYLLKGDLRVSRLPAAGDPQVLEVINQYLPQSESKQALTIHTFQKGFHNRKIFILV